MTDCWLEDEDEDEEDDEVDEEEDGGGGKGGKIRKMVRIVEEIIMKWFVPSTNSTLSKHHKGNGKKDETHTSLTLYEES